MLNPTVQTVKTVNLNFEIQERTSRCTAGPIRRGFIRVIKLPLLLFHTQKNPVRVTKAKHELSERKDSDWLLLQS